MSSAVCTPEPSSAIKKFYRSVQNVAQPLLWPVLARFGYGLGSGLRVGLSLRPYLDPHRKQHSCTVYSLPTQRPVLPAGYLEVIIVKYCLPGEVSSLCNPESSGCHIVFCSVRVVSDACFRPWDCSTTIALLFNEQKNSMNKKTVFGGRRGLKARSVRKKGVFLYLSIGSTVYHYVPKYKERIYTNVI